MKTAEDLAREIEKMLEQIDNIMLRMRNGYLEQERSQS